MTIPLDEPNTLLDAVLAWQRGHLFRDSLISLLSRVPENDGGQVVRVVQALCARLEQMPPGTPGRPDQAHDTDGWRDELMSSRAKAWAVPHPAGMLVGPHLIILVSGDQGVILREGVARCLPRSVCGSILLLCQTIMMAHSAVDARELRALRQQRIESTSTSLSEINPVE